MRNPLLRLQCGVNSYDWGKKGSNSSAARYAAATPAAGFSIEPEQPYAELWMGTHPSNPSYDTSTGRKLLDLIQDDEELVSPSIQAQYGPRLPFLFKILSIEKALSIQAHPDRKLAKQLHIRDPKNYPDDNHKPEMAIALTPFEALCGFRPLHEIAYFLDKVPALRELIGEEETKAFQRTAAECGNDTSPETKIAGTRALRRAFAVLMKASESTIESASRTLVNSAKAEATDFAGGNLYTPPGVALSELVSRLYGQFGPDHGLFVLFFANFVTLQPGEALFLQADEIHAYVSGDIVECMAASDNVVRAGFTAMFKDLQTLVDMLTYSYAPIEQQKLKPIEYRSAVLNQTACNNGSFVAVYDPPIEEFAIARSVLKGDGAKVTYPSLQGPSVAICTGGQGQIHVGSKTMDVHEGYIFFVGANVECAVESAGNDEDFEMFKAFCEVRDPSSGPVT